MFRTFSRATLTIDVGRRGGDIVEHHRGGNIVTEEGDEVTSVELRPINGGYW